MTSNTNTNSNDNITNKTIATTTILHNNNTDDESVQSTSIDSIYNKYICHKLGYINDKYIELFYNNISNNHNNNNNYINSPLINRGYYTRIYTIYNIIIDFINCCKQYNKLCNVIILGSGYDTTYYKLYDNNYIQYISQYIEIDFDIQIYKKCKIIYRYKNNIFQFLQPLNNNSNKYCTEYNGYTLLSCDLRNIEQLKRQLHSINKLDYTLPTIVISECVLIYMSSIHSNNIVKYFSEEFNNNLLFIDYTPIQPNTQFGRTMQYNMIQRNCELLSYNTFPTIDTYIQRYIQYNYTSGCGYTMYDIYNKYINKQDKQRIEYIEKLDEYEEWNIIMNHYCINIGYKQIIQQHDNSNHHNNNIDFTNMNILEIYKT